MGQKTHPYGFRLGVIKTWTSKWYENVHYAKWLHEDIRIKRAVKEYLYNANIAGVEIERAANKAKVASCGRTNTTPAVPTGMKAGVCTVPCGVVSVPARAAPLVASTAKPNIAAQYSERAARASNVSVDIVLYIVELAPLLGASDFSTLLQNPRRPSDLLF